MPHLDDIVLTTDPAGADWSALAALYAQVRCAERRPHELAAAFGASQAVVFAHAAGRLVGAARAISDGVYVATVVDVAVAADRQGHGIGRAMMDALIARLPVAKIYLASTPGKEGFYRKLGFAAQDNAMSLHPGTAAVSAATGTATAGCAEIR